MTNKIYSVFVSSVKNENAFCEYRVRTQEHLIFVSFDQDEAEEAARRAVSGVINAERRGSVVFTVTDDDYENDRVDNTNTHHTAFVVETEVGTRTRVKVADYSHVYIE